jgi:hypothetical protein
MDEPQVTSQVDETDGSAEKSDFNEVLTSAFGEEVEKPMEVDSTTSGEEPSTSADAVVTELTPEDTDAFAVPDPVDTEQDAGQSQDVSMSGTDTEANDTVEQVIFDKTESELDETAQSAVEGDTLDFTEASINISQLNVEHNSDDSNDAFNALKESETDALETPKEEIEDPKEPRQFQLKLLMKSSSHQLITTICYHLQHQWKRTTTWKV